MAFHAQLGEEGAREAERHDQSSETTPSPSRQYRSTHRNESETKDKAVASLMFDRVSELRQKDRASQQGIRRADPDHERHRIGCTSPLTSTRRTISLYRQGCWRYQLSPLMSKPRLPELMNSLGHCILNHPLHSVRIAVPAK